MRLLSRPRGRCRVCKVKMIMTGREYIDGMRKCVYKCPICNRVRYMNKKPRSSGTIELKPRGNFPLQEIKRGVWNEHWRDVA